MSIHLQIRDLPDQIHETLRQRAAASGVSLRQYSLEILRNHCDQPTLDEWLTGLDRLPPISNSCTGAEAVRQAREVDEGVLAGVIGRS